MPEFQLLPSPCGFCAGHSDRVSNSEASGDRHQPTAEAPPGTGQCHTPAAPCQRGTTALSWARYSPAAQKRLSTNPLVTYKAVLNVKKIQYTKKCDPV